MMDNPLYWLVLVFTSAAFGAGFWLARVQTARRYSLAVGAYMQASSVVISTAIDLAPGFQGTAAEFQAALRRELHKRGIGFAEIKSDTFGGE